MLLLLLAITLAPPALADDDLVAAGQAQFTARCLACHGPGAEGDGPAARALAATPADLTTPAFWKGMTDDKLRRMISSSAQAGAVHTDPPPAKELDQIVAWLNTLKPRSTE